MGMSEDDRIRSKNVAYNDAYKLFEDLSAVGYKPDFIHRYALLASQTTTCPIRSEVYKRLLSLTEGIVNETSNTAKRPTVVSASDCSGEICGTTSEGEAD